MLPVICLLQIGVHAIVQDSSHTGQASNINTQVHDTESKGSSCRAPCLSLMLWREGYFANYFVYYRLFECQSSPVPLL